MDMIQGAEWIVVAILVAGFLTSVYLIASVQGDLRMREESGLNTDEQATTMFIGLLNQTRRRIDIHDDGNDFAGSMYNSPEVIGALRERIQERNIKVRACLTRRTSRWNCSTWPVRTNSGATLKSGI